MALVPEKDQDKYEWQTPRYVRHEFQRQLDSKKDLTWEEEKHGELPTTVIDITDYGNKSS